MSTRCPVVVTVAAAAMADVAWTRSSGQSVVAAQSDRVAYLNLAEEDCDDRLVEESAD